MARRIKRPVKRVAKQSPTLVKARDELVRRCHGALLKAIGVRDRLSGGRPEARAGGVNPENMIWIFCISRSGSSWLRDMMVEPAEYRVWEEPSVGRLFGAFYTRAQRRQLASTDFIMGNATRKGWIRSIRNFVLDGARYAHPLLDHGHYLVVKEPDSSAGAPLIMEALPESRMIFLVRDPRDVVASALDALREGGWMHEAKDEDSRKVKTLADREPDDFVRTRAKLYLRQVGSIREAYNAHKGRKVLVRYEDLRADTLGTMRRLYSTLGIGVDEQELARAVAKHSWENVPEEEKGEGKFYRKAAPGGWREDLTPEQAKIIEDFTAPLLREFYP